MFKLKIIVIFFLSSTTFYSCTSDKIKDTSTSESEKIKEVSPLEIGKNAALKTKGILGKNLMHAIQTKGTEHALEFCSVKAISLTDSVALALNAKVKRVSDKNRNPNNAANEQELDYIRATKKLLAEGKKPKPQLVSNEENHLGYYPIIANQMCMQCHGIPNTEVLPNTLSKLGSLYPNDNALGYKSGDLRGIWVVEMTK